MASALGGVTDHVNGTQRDHALGRLPTRYFFGLSNEGLNWVLLRSMTIGSPTSALVLVAPLVAVGESPKS
jgi:hypothetical protein